MIDAYYVFYNVIIFIKLEFRNMGNKLDIDYL